jgi:hypothetical protein
MDIDGHRPRTSDRERWIDRLMPSRGIWLAVYRRGHRVESVWLSHHIDDLNHQDARNADWPVVLQRRP